MNIFSLVLVSAWVVLSAASPPAARAALPAGGIVPSEPDIGWTAGDFSVSDDGAAQYRLPLWVPDGRGRSAPKLALSYDSRAGNGLLGMGWTLAGLRMITWCPHTIAQDGYTDFAGHFDGSDELCLDGNRLVRLSPPQLPQAQYRTYRDPFARITGFGTEDNVPDYFTVESKDGLILTFGQGSARMTGYRLKPKPDPDNPGQPDFADPGLVPESPSTQVTTAWAVSKIEDRNGNAATIGYLDPANEANHTTMLPSTITYAPNRRVQFVYNDPSQPRPDVIDGYGGGVYFRNVRRLVRIEMWGGPQGGAAVKLRDYRLGYRNDSVTGRSLLVRVDECAPDGRCKLPLRMTYSPGNDNFQAMLPATLAGETQLAGAPQFNVRTGDVDGDGRADLIYRASDKTWVQRGTGAGTGFASPVQSPDVGEISQWGLRPVDIDADGRTDMMADTSFPTPDANGHMWQLFESSGSRFAKGSGSSVGINHDQQSPGDARDPGYLTDLDGNGLPDFVLLWTEPQFGNKYWEYRRNSGGTGVDRFHPFQIHERPTENAADAHVADTNGDGRAEVLQQRWLSDRPGGYVKWGLFPQGGVEFGTANIKNTFLGMFFIDQVPTDAVFGDLNGDGLQDAIITERSGAGENSVSWQLRAQVNSGNGFSSPAQPDPPSWTGVFRGVNGVSTGLFGLTVADFNADRRDDVLVFPCNESFCGQELYEWRNGAFVRAWRLPVSAVPLDVDADGLMDLVAAGAVVDGKRQATVYRHLGTRPDLLTSIGLRDAGPYAEITYTTLADAGVHIPCTDAVYPVACVKEGGSIVKQHRFATYAGNGGPEWDTYNHFYADARSDLQGRGWLGFGRHTVSRLLAGAITSTTFDNVTRDATLKLYPYAHLPKVVSAVVPTGAAGAARRSTTTNDNQIRRLETGFTVELQHVTEVEEERPPGVNVWQTLRTTATDATYDAFGNQDLVVTATTGGRKTTVDPTINNDTVRWLIGLPSRTVTTGCDAANACTARTTTFDYYPNGNLKTTVVEPGHAALELTTGIVYDEFGNPTSVTRTDSNGVSRTDDTEYGTAEKLYPTATVNALGHRTAIETDPTLGVRTRVTDPNGVATTMRYDTFGRLRETNHADGSFEHITHAARQTTVTRADGAITVMSVDQLGREQLRAVTAFDGRMATVETEYDARGQVARTSRPYLPGETKRFTTFTYDGLDRLKTTTAQDGAVISHSYQGLETHTVDAKGVESYTVDNADGDVTTAFEDDPNSTGWLKTSLGYDGFGQITRITAPDNTVQTMRYDVLGRRIEINDPSSGRTTTGYNAFGEVTGETDATGATTTYVVDGLGRVKTASSPDGRTTNTWDTAGNGIGKLASSNSPDGVFTRYGYDEFGHQTIASWKIEGETFEVITGYDDIGRPDSVTYPHVFFPGGYRRLRVENVYNASGYLSQVKDAAAGPAYWTALGRDAAGQLTTERLGNGVVTDYTYVPATGLSDTITITGPGAVGKLGELDYGYDLNRNVNLRHDKANKRYEVYTHDGLNRLQRWQARPSATGAAVLTSDYAYDTMGNLTTETTTRPDRPIETITYTYSGNGTPPHALTGRNGARYTYDAAGRQLTGPNRTVTYNTLDLPKTLDTNNGRHVQFRYDADGARALKRVGDVTTITAGGFFERRSPAGHASSEIHNLNNIVINGRIVAQVNLVQPAGGGEIIDTRVVYLHSDRQGSTTLVTNPSGMPYGGDESVFNGMFYDPWGRRLDDAYQPVPDNRTGGPRQLYTGQYHDDEIYLINMKGRMYDPHAHRFLSPDPVTVAPLSSQSHNGYAYVRNNPTTLTDPNGLCCDESAFAAAAVDEYAGLVSTLPELDAEDLELPLMDASGCECVAGDTEDYDPDSGMYDTAVAPADDPEWGATSEVEDAAGDAGGPPRHIKVWVNTFIPKAMVGPLAGDDRDFSSDIGASHRTHQEIEIDVASLLPTTDVKHTGTSHLMVPSQLFPPPGMASGGPWAAFHRPAFVPVMSDTASTEALANGPVSLSGNTVVVHFEVDASVPLVPGAPAVNLAFDFQIQPTSRAARLVGTHDGFPAYEAYVSADGGGGTAIYQYNPFTAGEGPFSLFPPMEHDVATPWIRF